MKGSSPAFGTLAHPYCAAMRICLPKGIVNPCQTCRSAPRPAGFHAPGSDPRHVRPDRDPGGHRRRVQIGLPDRGSRTFYVGETILIGEQVSLRVARDGDMPARIHWAQGCEAGGVFLSHVDLGHIDLS